MGFRREVVVIVWDMLGRLGMWWPFLGDERGSVSLGVGGRGGFGGGCVGDGIARIASEVVEWEVVGRVVGWGGDLGRLFDWRGGPGFRDCATAREDGSRDVGRGVGVEGLADGSSDVMAARRRVVNSA